MPYPSPLCCLTCWLLADQVVLFFFSLSLSLPRRPSSLSRPCVSTQNVSVCTFKWSPCVPAPPRAHVFQHVRVVPVHTRTFGTYTRRFSACHTTHHNTRRNTPIYITNNTQQHITTQHTKTRPQHHTRQRQREKAETREDKRRQDKTKEKRRQDKTIEKTRQEKRK